MKFIKFWVTNARYHALMQSFIPAVLALTLAFGQPGFSPVLGLLAVFGAAMGHLGVNLLDDYFDYRVQKSGYRDDMARAGMRARIAKCVYLTSGEATVDQLWRASLAFCGLALLAGLVIFLERGWPIAVLTAAAAALGWAYSGRPLRLSYRGLGELAAAVMFGPLLMSGVYYAAAGSFGAAPLFVSVPAGLLVANILYVHSILDFEPDKEVGKASLAVLIGDRKASLTVLAAFLLLPYLFILGGVALGFLPDADALVLLTAPLAIHLFWMMRAFVRDPDQSFQRRPWMGPMHYWPRAVKFGTEWFMLRWYLARNLLDSFCLILILVHLLSR